VTRFSVLPPRTRLRISLKELRVAADSSMLARLTSKGMSAPITQESLQFQGYPRRCVLIIDDDPAFTLLASETLQQAGFDARIASNAKEAVASFERDKPTWCCST